ncbi:MAG: hypothetical protein ACI9E3_001231, partial [Flavobacteriales bacterium]
NILLDTTWFEVVQDEIIAKAIEIEIIFFITEYLVIYD